MKMPQKLINSRNLVIQAKILELESLIDFFKSSTINSFYLSKQAIHKERYSFAKLMILGINGKFNHNAITADIHTDIGYCFEDENEFKSNLFESKIKPSDFFILCDFIFKYLSTETIESLYEEHLFIPNDSINSEIINKYSLQNLIIKLQKTIITGVLNE